MGILGYGVIGRYCVWLGQVFGMEVYVYICCEKVMFEVRKDDSYVVFGIGDFDGLILVKWYYGFFKELINEFFVQDFDLLVISLFFIDVIKYIISKEQFDILVKKKMFVLNIVWGQYINLDDLIEVLKEGKIRGVVFDVVDFELFIDGYLFWSVFNVFIMFYVSWQIFYLFQCIQVVVERNLEGLSGQKLMLINVMNKMYGY